MSMKSYVPTDPSKGGRTRQSEKAACDVNLIVAQHVRGGVSTHVVGRVAEYGFVPAGTFHEAMNQVREAQEVFDSLPAATRAHFANDPGRFVEYVSDQERLDELVKLGLAIPKEKPVPALGTPDNPIVTRSVDAEAGSPPIG